MDKSDNDEIKNMIDFGDDTEKTRAINIPKPETTVYGNEENVKEDTKETEVSNKMPNADEITADGGDDSADDTDVIDDIDDKNDDTDDDGYYDYDDDDDDDEYDEIEPEYVFEDDNTVVPKKTKILRIGVISGLLVAVIIAFSVIDTGFIGTYKTNFANNFRHIFGIPVSEVTEDENAVTESENTAQETETETDKTDTKKTQKNIRYSTDEKMSVTVPYEYAGSSDYAKYGNGVVCAATNHMRYINSDGETEWECTTSVIDPILVTAGKYIFIAQDGGTKICLYENDTLIYDTDTESNILTADVSENGDSVLVTERDLYKGSIEAYNKRGDCIYLWSSGDMNVTDASISPSSRDIAAVLVNTDSEVYSAVRIFDIAKEGVKNENKFDNTLLFDVKYFGDVANAFGDNAIVGVNSSGKVTFNLSFDNAPIIHYAYDEDGNKLVCAELDNVPTLMTFSAGGKLKKSAAADEIPSFLGICGKRAVYNADRYIILGKIGASKLSLYTAAMDIKEIIMIDKNTFFAVYSNSLQLVKM